MIKLGIIVTLLLLAVVSVASDADVKKAPACGNNMACRWVAVKCVSLTMGDDDVCTRLLEAGKCDDRVLTLIGETFGPSTTHIEWAIDYFCNV